MAARGDTEISAAGGHALVDEIAAKIRERIMSGDIPIGAQLRQAELASDFGVSRTPVREALRQLQTGGLIEVLPNRGAVVRVPAPWEVREAYEVRAELEALAAARAVERISRGDVTRLREANQDMYDRSVERERGQGDPALASRRENDVFHNTIAQVSANARLARAIDEINEPSPATCRLSCSSATTATARRTSRSTSASSRRSSGATPKPPAARCASTSSRPASSWRAGTSGAPRRCSPADAAQGQRASVSLPATDLLRPA